MSLPSTPRAVPTAVPARGTGLAAAALAIALGIAGCTTMMPQALKAGDSVDDVLRRHGPPTAEHAGPEGGRQLEYWSGPWGTVTYMLHFDAQGRLLRWENVLDEAHFARIQPGLTTRQVRERLGPPSRQWQVRYHDQTVWSYRFGVSTCLLFHVGITPGGVVEDTSYGPDPACEPREPRERLNPRR